MRKLCLLLLGSLFFIACQNEPKRYFAESAETNTLKSGIAAYEAGDWEKWQSHFSDTAKIFVNSNKPMKVSERAKELKTMAGAMSSYGFNHDKEYIEMVLDKEDETWVYYWGTHKGTFATTKKELTIPVHLAVQFVDGKIVEEHVYFDGTAMNGEFKAIASMSDADKNIRASIDTFIGEFLNKKDASVLGDLLSKDYKRFHNDKIIAEGSSELETNISPFFKGFSDFKVELLHTSTIVENAIFVHWKATGTHDGEFSGIPATGKKIDVNGLSRLQYDDEGKLKYEHLYYDQLTLMQQLGKSLN
ncbi:ester cyclase [Hyunsoonleella sp. SJ7]|uniref:Ester cyclase n=1 Tax=Hyunsoonleella aquatilis TaxID=2762758 RepID=A0A923HF35_9FLAO|nr:nuclear transport factor 2 family protein [Hyunsoonleella aquatilis]MBC3759088.1 ester cyclase [Hyunsoonleella aquatilis]